ncbi:MAG: hypothetical protein K6C41_08200 [Lachnospiraceae bacterium]|nr:hypothetical protein [Lachnospiraceae bacterium]
MMRKQSEADMLESFRRMTNDADLKLFRNSYLKKHTVTEELIGLLTKTGDKQRSKEETLPFYILVLYNEVMGLPSGIEMISYIQKNLNLTRDDCCDIINGIKNRRKNNIAMNEASPVALLNDLMKEGRLIRYEHMYGRKALKEEDIVYLIIPYKCDLDWYSAPELHIAAVLGNFIFPDEIRLREAGQNFFSKLKGILTPMDRALGFSDFLKISEQEEPGSNVLRVISHLLKQGITLIDEQLIDALYYDPEIASGLRKDSLTKLRGNPAWNESSYSLRTGIIACYVLGGFLENEEARGRALSFPELLDNYLPSRIYPKIYDPDTKGAHLIDDFVRRGILRFVPAGEIKREDIIVPVFSSSISQKTLCENSELLEAFKNAQDLKLWVKELELPSELSAREILEIEDDDARKAAISIVRTLYMPKDDMAYYAVNEDALAKEGEQTMNEIKLLLWISGSGNGNGINLMKVKAIFEKLEAQYDPEFAVFLIRHYNELKSSSKFRNVLPRIQEYMAIYKKNRSGPSFKDMSLPELLGMMARDGFVAKAALDNDRNALSQKCKSNRHYLWGYGAYNSYSELFASSSNGDYGFYRSFRIGEFADIFSERFKNRKSIVREKKRG